MKRPPEPPADRPDARTQPDEAIDAATRIAVCEQTLEIAAAKLGSLLELGHLIALDLDIDKMVVKIAQKAVEVMNAGRFRIFIHDPAADELWSRREGPEACQDRRSVAGGGLAAYCFRTGATINVGPGMKGIPPDAAVDETEGAFKTILSTPFYSRDGRPLGVMQLLDKERGPFTDEDLSLLTVFNNHAAVFIEMAQLQKARFDALEKSREDAERLGRAKGEALDHLAHELNTPLGLVRGTLRILRRRWEKGATFEELGGFFVKLDEYVDRLYAIEREAEKILRTYAEAGAGNLLDEADRKRSDSAEMTGDLPRRKGEGR